MNRQVTNQIFLLTVLINPSVILLTFLENFLDSIRGNISQILKTIKTYQLQPT